MGEYCGEEKRAMDPKGKLRIGCRKQFSRLWTPKVTPKAVSMRFHRALLEGEPRWAPESATKKPNKPYQPQRKPSKTI